ncbi:hypothetical protein [Gellertiella hungarica]|uniref:Uncharacterized protein n=1 Tax=Gellertiella hungarica TaxID=1572859 RepID=A0A7W6J4R6_9HYPH|nr:hypothetical protein [Gellertiella hungarica]MBB4064022.1 hypothetical protein [Gellertiella hungarica]
MTIKSAEPHTIAPRLGYLEDKVDYLASRSGGDGGTDPSPLLEKLWKATLLGATTDGSFSETPWNDPPLYDPETVGSLHMTVFGAVYGSQNAQACQDGYGMYGKIFGLISPEWSPSALGFRPLVEDIYYGGPDVGSFRSAGVSLSRSIWHDDASMLGSDRPSTIIGRIEALRADLEQLANSMEAEIERLDNAISGMH